MMEIISKYKTTIILIVVFLVISILGYFGVKSFIQNTQSAESLETEEIDITFDPEGAYGVLTPRRDGNALVLVIRRIASYDEFSYQLTYSGEDGVDRGAGDLNTWIKLPKDKTEYEQELLLGSCSKNVCSYDKGVEFGTLVIHFKKGNKIYKTSSQWHLQRPDIALGKLNSGDAHFSYTLENAPTLSPTTTSKKAPTPNPEITKDIWLLGFTVVNDLSGAPKLPNGRIVVGKVYALNSISGKDIPGGDIKIELPDAVPADTKIAVFTLAKGDWELLDSTVKDGVIEAKAPSGGIFAVLSPQ